MARKIPQYKKEGEKNEVQNWYTLKKKKKKSIHHVQTLSGIPASEESGHCTAMQCFSSVPLRNYAYFGCLVGSSLAWQTRSRHASTTIRWMLASPNSVAPVLDKVGALQEESTQKRSEMNRVNTLCDYWQPLVERFPECSEAWKVNNAVPYDMYTGNYRQISTKPFSSSVTRNNTAGTPTRALSFLVEPLKREKK